MSKQIYIDSNGNEIQVSGTVNTADMMPMSGNDSTKVSDAIGDLSQLTTSDKSSLVGAVNVIDKSLDFQTAKSVKFQVASGRLLIYLYTDDLKQNGMRIDFDSSANVIELSSITNGTTAPTNRITFNHV